MNKNDFKLKVFSLSERLYPMVARMLGNATSTEDAIQDIMMRLWDKRKHLEHHPNITGFVFLTARNYCIDVLRKNKSIVDDATPYLKVLKSGEDHKDVEWEELNTIIQNVLKALPEQQQEVFMMRDIDGYEFTEIAVAMAITVEHARVLLSRARKQIGIVLENTYSYERGDY
jgi:RNA polymerase sigma-70 factor (ECF subfamily)